MAADLTFYVETLTLDEVKQLIQNGNNQFDNQIRVTKNGYVFLAPGIVTADTNIDNLQFYFDSFDAGNDYVGLRAANDIVWITKVFRGIKICWSKKVRVYTDSWGCFPN